MVVGADRKSMRYRSCRAVDGDLRSRLCELAQQRRRFGYRRLHILLRRDGIMINRKKTQRPYREEGLRVILARWTHDYNTERPHSSLGYATPAAFAAELEQQRARLNPPVASSALMRENTGRSLAAAG